MASRAAVRLVRFAVEPLETSTPPDVDGKPNRSVNHRMTCRSTCVAD
jgi:hypothetical protein